MQQFRVLIKPCLILLLLCSEIEVSFGVSPFPAEHKVRIDVQWPAVSSSKTFEEDEYEDLLIMTSPDKSQYRCTLPSLHTNEPIETVSTYKGPTPLELLKPIFSKLLCYFRLETYWTYELCHGNYFRQFHEESSARGRVVQEFFLGKYDSSSLNAGENSSAETDTTDLTKDLPTVRVDDAELPYLVINMSDGTFCALRNKPRFTRVLYVCHPRGNNGIYSFRETTTCEYEVIVLTTVLCKHPAFRIDYFMEGVINCYPLPGSPPQPKSFQDPPPEDKAPEAEKEDASKPEFQKKGKKTKVVEEEQDVDDKPEVKIEEVPEWKVVKRANVQSTVIKKQSNLPHDQKLMEDVLNGDYCLHGGGGWWRYEFCYGKQVQQYHENANGDKEYILLGVWNVNKHLSWLEKYPLKKMKKGKPANQMSHFYSDGAFCHEANKPRQLEVKLKCKEIEGHADSVTLYFSEPQICEYIITVESPIFCTLIKLADENGLTPNMKQ